MLYTLRYRLALIICPEMPIGIMESATNLMTWMQRELDAVRAENQQLKEKYECSTHKPQ